jgi:hypothetical protein
MPITVNVRDVTKVLREQFDSLTGRQVAQAASSAINKTLAVDRVFIGREIRRVYNMGVFDAKSEISQGMSSINTLTGTLSGNAGFTPFEYFKVSGENSLTGEGFKLKRKSRYTIVNGKRKVSGKNTSISSPGQGRHATFEVSIFKGQATLFTHAFIANSKNGPMLFNRGSYDSRTNVFGSISSRNPMERLRTLSVWQEMNNGKIVGKSEFLLKQEYEREFYRLLLLRLSGKGGWR